MTDLMIKNHLTTNKDYEYGSNIPREGTDMQHSVIHKYTVTPSPDVQELQVPVNSFIVSAVAEGGQIAMYVLKHNPDQPFVDTLQYLLIGTGWNIPNEGNAQFVATVKTGQYVWHLFSVSELPF